MMRGDENIVVIQRNCEGDVACPACSSLKAIAAIACDIDVDDLHRHTDSAAEPLALQRPLTGIGMQAVMDVHGGQADLVDAVMLRKPMQQHGGIEPAAQRDKQPPSRRESIERRWVKADYQVGSRWFSLRTSGEGVV